MDWIDYREKLGIGFNDPEKFSYFITKIFNYLNLFASSSSLAVLSTSEYCDFCNVIGSKLNIDILNNYDSTKRYEECIQVLRKNSKDLKSFLTYYVAFTNANKKNKQNYEEGWQRRDYANLASNMLRESHIPFDLVEMDDEYFIFPKGATELDDALVSEPLEWLKNYPNARKEWIDALKNYSDLTDGNASNVADQFRKSLERFFQEFFNSSKSLENLKPEYGAYMKANGVPSEISKNFETLLQSYTNFMNNYAKHHNKTSKNVLEYIMYQTGNIIRLLITLRQNGKGEKQ